MKLSIYLETTDDFLSYSDQILLSFGNICASPFVCMSLTFLLEFISWCSWWPRYFCLQVLILLVSIDSPPVGIHNSHICFYFYVSEGGYKEKQFYIWIMIWQILVSFHLGIVVFRVYQYGCLDENCSLYIGFSKFFCWSLLKLVSAIFYQMFISHQMIALQKLWKMLVMSWTV